MEDWPTVSVNGYEIPYDPEMKYGDPDREGIVTIVNPVELLKRLDGKTLFSMKLSQKIRMLEHQLHTQSTMEGTTMGRYFSMDSEEPLDQDALVEAVENTRDLYQRVNNAF